MKLRKAIGIDLGGTKINAALVMENGVIIDQCSTKTINSGSPDIILKQLEEISFKLMDGQEVCGIGIGTPGFVDSENGRILAVGGNITGWAWTDVAGKLSKQIDVPIKVENDANCAAVCEAWLGSGRELESFVMLTIGTGLGGAIWMPSIGVWRGANYRAAELGHSILYPNGRGCNCGQEGCAERYISGSALEKNYLEITGRSIPGNSIVDSYLTDFDARKSVDRFADDLGTFIVSIRNILDPQGIIIGGGVSTSRNVWWGTMMDSFNRKVNDASSMQILPAQYENEAGMLGAAKCVFNAI